jgi:hypothetical protein
MAIIIAGRFQTFDQADQAVQALIEASIPPNDVSVFYVNPPGQHDATPIGGDHPNADPGAEDSTDAALTGAAAGGAIGLAVGIAATALPLVGAAAAVAAAGVGAYTGSFAGGLNGAGENETPTPAPRRAGVMVAVRSNDEQASERVSVALSAQGAEDVEMADGAWQDGTWIDFDPVTPARLITTPAGMP